MQLSRRLLVSLGSQVRDQLVGMMTEMATAKSPQGGGGWKRSLRRRRKRGAEGSWRREIVPCSLQLLCVITAKDHAGGGETEGISLKVR